jgi:uncharacterized protein
MLTTRYVTGSPNWIDLGTPDIEDAAAFYGGLFGWDFRPGGPEVGGYGMFQLDGRTTAGGMSVPPDQGPPAWGVYFQTPDTGATAEAVRGAGGSVVAEPMDVMDLGRMAVFADSSGVPFATWQPGTNHGLDVVSDPYSVCWLELYTPDPAGALDFYRQVFGWGSTVMPLPEGDGDYVMVHPGGENPDAMFGGIVPIALDPLEDTPHWLPYFEVPDCDAVTAKASELGGRVRMAPVTMEGVGRFAKLADRAGARFALMTGSDETA